MAPLAGAPQLRSSVSPDHQRTAVRPTRSAGPAGPVAKENLMRRRILASILGLALVTVGVTAALVRGTAPTAAAGTAPAATLIGHWTFDEGSGTTAADSSGNGHPLTLQGGAGWTTGVVGPYALSVTPQQDAASSGPVIDTSASFTVSAWVKLDNTNGYQTFVSEDGSNVAAFYLQLRGDTGRFAFTRLAYDSTAAYGA